MASEKLATKRAEHVKNMLVATFFIQAVVTASIVIRVPEVIANLGLTKNLAIWGTITGLTGSAAMLSLVFAHRLIKRFGTTRVVRYGTLVSTAIQGTLPLFHNYWLYFLVTFIQAFFFSLYNTAANGQGLMVQKRLGRVILGSLHGAWSLGVGIATILSGILASLLPLDLHIGLISALGFIAHLFINTQLMNRKEEAMSQTREKVEPKTPWIKTPWVIWLLGFGIAMGIWPELVMGDWMSLYSKQVLHVATGLIAIPFTGFASAMIIGRFSTGWVSKRMQINRFGMFGGYVGGVAMALGIVSSLVLLPINELLAVSVEAAFFFIAGLGESVMVPAFYSAASHVRGIASTQAIARMGMVSSLSLLLAKGVMGSLADSVGLALAMIFPILAFFGSGYFQGLASKHSTRMEVENLQNYPPTGSTPVIEL